MSRIFCVSHKPIALPAIKGLELIQVGAGEENFAALRDNTGDNIADRNNAWSENTAFYHIWKNQPADDAIGFCHYRRFLLPGGVFEALRGNLAKPYDAESTKGMCNYASGFHVDEQTLFSALEADGENYTAAFDDLLEDAEIVLPHHNPLYRGGFLQQYVAAHPA